MMFPTVTIRVLFVAFLFLICSLALPSAHAQVGVSWDASSGNWSVPTNWNPAVVPNNVGDARYAVTIDTIHSVVTMDVLNDTIDNLTLGATNSLNVNAGRSMRLVNGVTTNFGTINNFGTIELNPTFSFSDFINRGTLNNTGTFNTGNVPGNPFTNLGILTNTGTINGSLFNSGGAVTIASSGTLNGGYFQPAAGSTVLNGTLNGFVDTGGGTLSGTGTINTIGPAGIGGTIMAGTIGNPGTFNINGNHQIAYSYVQGVGAVYNEQISSTANGLLNIDGGALLEPRASLDIHLLGGFVPSAGTNFIVMDYAFQSGTLTITDPSISRTEHWVITSYSGGGGHNLVLTAEAGPVTPEPSTFLLFGTGIIGLCGYLRKKKIVGVIRNSLQPRPA
jgi:hypothetical protein